MDIAADTAHLYDDSKFNDECVKLDVKNQLDTKQQNRREAMGLEMTTQILNRQKSLTSKYYNREMRLLKDGLQDIYVKTPYFSSFWRVDAEEAKKAVLDRLVGRQHRQKKHDVLPIETVPEDEVIDIKQSYVGKWPQNEPKKLHPPVRRSKSEPVPYTGESTTSSSGQSGRSGQTGRFRSSSLSALLQIDRTRASSEADAAIFPRGESRSTKYETLVFTKPLPKKLPPLPTDEEDLIRDSRVKAKSRGMVRAAKFHSKSLDKVYFRRSTSNIVTEKSPMETGLEFEELPDNPVLRAHFISQANSKRILDDIS